MHITRVILKNYRCLNDSTVTLNDRKNIIVGNNECGKSTFLEAVHLALTGQLNGRSIYGEIHPHLFSRNIVSMYMDALKSKSPLPPPSILIELYFNDDPTLAKLKGINNSKKEDVPGVKMSIEFNEDYNAEYTAYVADPEHIKTIPVEYYTARWRDFADNDVTSRSIPIKPSFVDASMIRNNLAASRYVVDIVKDSLDKTDQVDLALAYRSMKDKFLDDTKVAAINATLASKKGQISQKTLSLSLDVSSRTNWESGIMPHLDDIPISLSGKGEQNSIKIKLAMESSAKCQILLIEEIENHLSFSNLNKLINHISSRCDDRQLLITTHSSFVLNKLGIESVLLFSNGKSATLNALEPETKNYFIKLPGHDTLRLILAKRTILVEGPSDELIVQKAFLMKHGAMPLERGVDIISVGSLAFKRFLDIAHILSLSVDIVTDNDGDVSKLRNKFDGYFNSKTTRIHFDDDEKAPTLEPQIAKCNSLASINKILGKSFTSSEKLLSHMKDNKTECALKFFETKDPWQVPEYITRAVAE